MKQTNNAIKFLMAQYRAIFRNANLKMFLAAATAAAALAAGQAQAANGSTFKNDGFKHDSAVTITATGTDQADDTKNEYKNFTISGGKADANKAFTNEQLNVLTVTGGKEASSSVFKGADADAVGTINLANTKLMIAGTADNATDAVVKVGEGTSGAAVTLGSVEASKGTIEIAKGSLTATSIDLNDKSKLTLTDGSVSATNLNLNSGSATEITKGTLGGTSNTIIINADATVEGAGTQANEAKLVGTVTLSGGKINVAAQKHLTIGGSFVAEKGTVTLAAQDANLVLANGGTFKAGTLENSGSITIGGDTTFEKGAVVTGKIGDNATITIGSTADKTVKLNLDSADFKLLTASDKNARKIKAADTAGTTSEIVFSDTAGTLNLGKNGDGALSILDETNGQLVGAVLDKQTNGKFKLSGKAATFGHSVIDTNTEFAFDSFSAGKKADGTELKVSGGAVISVKDGLTVIAKDPAKAALNIVDGKIYLNGTNGKAGSVSASTVALKGADKAKAQFNISGGDWTVTGLEVTSGDVSIGRDASLIINGGKFTSAAEKTHGVISVDGGHINAAKASEVALKKEGVVELKNTATITLDKSKIFDQAGTALDNTKFAAGSVVGDANTKLIIMDGANKLKFADDKAFQDFYTKTGFKGLFDVDFTPAVKSGDQAFTALVAGLDNNSYKDVTATTTGAEGVSGVYAVGKVKVTDNNDLSIKSGGALTLNGANGGDFVVKTPSAGKTETANIDFAAAGTSLTLKGAGNLGSVTATTNGEGALTIGSTGDEATQTKPVPGIVTVLKGNSIGTDANKRVGQVIVNEQSTLNIESGSVFTNNLAVHDDASFNVSGDILAESAQVDGVLHATGTLTLSGAGTNNFASADVNVGKLALGSATTKLNIGHYDPNDAKNDATGSVYASSLDLNGGSVFIDPNSNQQYSVLAVNTLSGGVVDGVQAGTLNGTVNVGNNGVFGVGFEDKADLTSYLSKYTNLSGGLNPEHFSSALVLNKQITLGASDGLFVGKDAKGDSATANQLTIKPDAALVVSDEAFNVVKGKKTGAAITTETNATVDVTDAKLVLIGDFSGADEALEIIKGPTSITGKFKVASANGLLTGSQVTNGTYKLTFDKDAAIKKGAFADASAPVRELLFKKLEGKIHGEGAGFQLLSDGATASLSGLVPDAAYHAATYAGAQVAAVAAVGTMAEAVGGRVGSMGVEATAIDATGSVGNGGVWVAPMYKSVDADGFNAEGASYGADVDLAGVAFGTDTVNGNMRFGAVFNIGSGDADGKGNGNGLKDEFDYYGFGIYSVMGFGQLAIVGDASLNVISHEVEGLGLKGSADTTAVTMGITGQYTISTPSVDVTPHLGARFIRLDTDSYDLKEGGDVVLNTDFDVQNVFSIPLGVSLSKAFEMGGWSLAPSADLSITFNTGDTEVKSFSTAPGTTGADAHLTTEVLDEVTYGVAVGLGAQYGAFGTNIGLNYTGSSNTDSFGVNAQARYMF